MVRKEGRSATVLGYKETKTCRSAPGAKNIHFSGAGTHGNHTWLSQGSQNAHAVLSQCWAKAHSDPWNLFGHNTVKSNGREGCSNCSSIFLQVLHIAFLCTALAASPLASPLNAEMSFKAFIFVEAHQESAWKVSVHVWHATSLYHLKTTCSLKKRLISKIHIKQV